MESHHKELTINRTLMLTDSSMGTGDLDSTLKLVAQTARRWFAADICTVIPINPITKQPVGQQPVVDGVLRWKENPSWNSQQYELTMQLLGGGDTLFVEDLSIQVELENRFMRRENIRSFTMLCLRTPNRRLLGIVQLYFRSERRFSEEEKNLLNVFLHQSTAVMQHSWSLWRYQRVGEIGKEINQILDHKTIENVFHNLYSRVSQIIDTSTFFMLGLHRRRTNKLDIYMMEYNQYSYRPEVEVGGASDWVLKEKESVLVTHYSKQRRKLPFRPKPIKGTHPRIPEAHIFVPLLLRGISIGLLSVQQDYPNAYDEEDKKIFGLLGNQVALAISNMHLLNNLNELNTAGQRLLRQLNSEHILDEMSSSICVITGADAVILYPYVKSAARFIHPPGIGGRLFQTTYDSSEHTPHDDTALLTLRQPTPVYAHNGSALYEKLGSKDRKGQGNFVEREQIASAAAVPLRVNNEEVGAMFVNYRQRQHFDPPQKQLIEGLATYAAIAIKNSREFSELATRHSTELEVFRNIDQWLNKAFNLEETLQAILELAARNLHGHKSAELDAAIILYNPYTKNLETKAAIGDTAKLRLDKGREFPVGRGLVGQTFQNKTPAVVGDVENEHPWCEYYYPISPDIKSELDVPLVDRQGHAVGVINFESRRLNAFTREDEQFLSTLAERAVLAINNVNAYQEAKQNSEELSTVHKVSREILLNSYNKERGLAEVILDYALELTKSSAGQIMLYDAYRENLYNAAERGVLPDKRLERMPIDRGIIGYVMRHHRPCNVDVREPEWRERYVEFVPNVHYELCVPIGREGGGMPRGVVNIERQEPQPFTQRDENLLLGLARFAEIGLHIAEQYKKNQDDQKMIQALREIDSEIIAELGDMKGVMNTIVKWATELTRSERGYLHIYPGRVGEAEQIWFAEREDEYAELKFGYKDCPYDIRPGIVRLVATEKESYITKGDAEEDVNYVPYPGDPEVHSEVAVRLESEGKLVGVLNMESPRLYAFVPEDVERLKAFAGQAVIAIRQARHHATLQEARERITEAEVMTTVGDSVSWVLHKVNNGVAMVESATGSIRKLLKKDEVDRSAIEEKLKDINEGAEKLTILRNSIRQIIAEKNEDTKGSVKPVRITVKELLQEAKKHFPPVPKQIRLEIRESDENLADIYVAPDQIFRALYHLILNAVDAIGPDNGSITLRAYDADSLVAIDVTDTGPGIPADHTSNIFSPGFSTKNGGLGVGLWSARRNVLLNGGRLGLSSQPGRGATFTLSLPKAERLMKVTNIDSHTAGGFGDGKQEVKE